MCPFTASTSLWTQQWWWQHLSPRAAPPLQAGITAALHLAALAAVFLPAALPGLPCVLRCSLQVRCLPMKVLKVTHKAALPALDYLVKESRLGQTTWWAPRRSGDLPYELMAPWRELTLPCVVQVLAYYCLLSFSSSTVTTELVQSRAKKVYPWLGPLYVIGRCGAVKHYLPQQLYPNNPWHSLWTAQYCTTAHSLHSNTCLDILSTIFPKRSPPLAMFTSHVRISNCFNGQETSCGQDQAGVGFVCCQNSKHYPRQARSSWIVVPYPGQDGQARQLHQFKALVYLLATA